MLHLLKVFLEKLETVLSLPLSSQLLITLQLSVFWLPCNRTRKFSYYDASHLLIIESVYTLSVYLFLLCTALLPWLSWAHSHMTPYQLSSLTKRSQLCKGQTPKSPSSGLTSLQNFRFPFLTNFSAFPLKMSWICSGLSHSTYPEFLLLLENCHHNSIWPSRKPPLHLLPTSPPYCPMSSRNRVLQTKSSVIGFFLSISSVNPCTVTATYWWTPLLTLSLL